MYDHLQGAREQYFVQLLSWIPLMYVRCVFVQYAAVCRYRRFDCVFGAPVRVRSGHRVYDSMTSFCLQRREVLCIHILKDFYKMSSFRNERILC